MKSLKTSTDFSSRVLAGHAGKGCYKLQRDLKAVNLLEDSVWYSITIGRLWVLVRRESTCARADFQSAVSHPWSALTSLSINGTNQCRNMSVVGSDALRKCRQIPSVLLSLYLRRISDTLLCRLCYAVNANCYKCQDYRCLCGALTFLLPTQSDWGDLGQTFLNLQFNSITKYLLLSSSL